MSPASVPLAELARFSADGRVWRSFGRLLAAQPGRLLAVPDVLAAGDFRALHEGSPVPWEEVLAAVDSPLASSAKVLAAEELAAVSAHLAALFPPHGWAQDSVSFCKGGRRVPRVTSPDGVVFVWVRGRARS